VQALKTAIKIFLRKAGLETGVKQNTALLVWDEVVGENIAENLQPKPENAPGEIITVFVKSPDEIAEFFKQEKKQGVQYDVKLYTYFMVQGLL